MKTPRDDSIIDDSSTFGRIFLSWTAWAVTIVLQCILGAIATQYDASHTHSARYPLPSRVCIPSIGNPCLLQLTIPTTILDPSPVLFINAVMLYASAVLATYNLRRTDSYQDYILAVGILGGAVVSGSVGTVTGYILKLQRLYACDHYDEFGPKRRFAPGPGLQMRVGVRVTYE